MLSVYLFAAIVGTGLLLFSLLGGHHGGGDAGVGHEVALGHGDVGHGHPVLADAEHPGVGEAIISLFRPRNIIFFAAGFGLTGTLLTLLRTNPPFTLLASLGMGTSFFVLSHTVFSFLRRSDTATEALTESEFLGERGRVTLPLEQGRPGRIACLIAGREVHLTAHLSDGSVGEIPAGREVVVVKVVDGVAEVCTPEQYERQLPA